MKRILGLVVVVIASLCFSVTAFAEEEPVTSGDTAVGIGFKKAATVDLPIVVPPDNVLPSTGGNYTGHKNLPQTGSHYDAQRFQAWGAPCA